MVNYQPILDEGSLLISAMLIIVLSTVKSQGFAADSMDIYRPIFNVFPMLKIDRILKLFARYVVKLEPLYLSRVLALSISRLKVSIGTRSRSFLEGFVRVFLYFFLVKLTLYSKMVAV